MLLNVYNDCAILSEIPTFGDKKKREVVQVLIILVLKEGLELLSQNL